jgi:prolyl 4-hydroxylase
MFKEYKLPKESFISGWFISEKICDDLISYYEKFKHNATPGKFNQSTYIEDTKKWKESLDLFVKPNNSEPEILSYTKVLQEILNLYLKKYPEANKYDRFNSEGFNIQHYPKKGGFKRWHFETGSSSLSKRVLVFMTYLNNLEKGGTIFKYQKITTPSKKGLTLIWPTNFTHTHKGQILNKEKMITTGWFTLL